MESKLEVAKGGLVLGLYPEAFWGAAAEEPF